MDITVYDQSGKKAGSVKVSDVIFATEVNEELVHQALVRQLANARMGIAHTKQRGERRGGGRKPFRQKGTGRARQGSIRSPQQRGGGIVFGPRNDRNYSKAMPKKQRRKALFSALTSRAQDGAIIALEKYEDKEAKTKKFADMLNKLSVERNALIVVDRDHKQLVTRVSKNMPNVKVILPQYLNVADLLKHQNVIFTKTAITEVESIFTS